MRPIFTIAIMACIAGCSSVAGDRQAVESGLGPAQPVPTEVSRQIDEHRDTADVHEVSRRTEVHFKYRP